MMDIHEDLNNHAKKHGLPITTHELKPSLLNRPLTEHIGRGKLLQTPQTSNGKRACSISWKLLPIQNFLSELQRKYGTTKILNVTGSRLSESNARKASLEKRSESPDGVVKTSLGWSQSIIMDWSLNDVWSLFKVIDDGDIESFSERFHLLKKHYATANAGTCDLFSGDTNKNQKECGSRFGCWICSHGSINDKSLESQIATDEKTYGFMAPLTCQDQFF